MTLRGALLEIVISGLIRARLGEAVSQSPSAVFKGRPHGAVKERKKTQESSDLSQGARLYEKKRQSEESQRVPQIFFFCLVWFFPHEQAPANFHQRVRMHAGASHNICLQRGRILI